MANYYETTVFETKFSNRVASACFIETLDLLSDLFQETIGMSELPDALADHFQGEEDFTGMPDDWQLSEDGEVVVSASEFDPHPVACALQHTMKEHGISRPQTFEWASTCDKDRIGGFGGGACVVFQDRIEFMHTSTFVARMLSEAGF